MDFLHFGDESVRSGGAERASGLCSWLHGGVVAIIDFEWTFGGRRMCTVVMCEHSKGKPFCPIGLEVIDEHSEVFFNLLIDSFSLSIGLGVKGSRGIALDLEKVVEVFHEF